MVDRHDRSKCMICSARDPYQAIRIKDSSLHLQHLYHSLRHLNLSRDLIGFWANGCTGHTHSRRTWAENIVNIWLPYTSIGDTLENITLILRCKSKMWLNRGLYSHSILHGHVKILDWMLSTAPIIMLNIYFFFKNHSSKVEKYLVYNHVCESHLLAHVHGCNMKMVVRGKVYPGNGHQWSAFSLCYLRGVPYPIILSMLPPYCLKPHPLYPPICSMIIDHQCY